MSNDECLMWGVLVFLMIFFAIFWVCNINDSD